MSCWAGPLTFEFCCSGAYGVGNTQCWDAFATWETCCRPEFDARGISAPAPEDPGCWVGGIDFDFCCSGKHGVGNPVCWVQGYSWDLCCKPEIEAREAQGVTQRAQKTAPHRQQMVECFTDYDDSNFRRWFIAQSGVPMKQQGNVGSPEACEAGAHHFYFIFVQLGLRYAPHGSAGPLQTVDTAAEFGLCVPRSCSHEVVETIIMPFYLGPWVGKPWGPEINFGAYAGDTSVLKWVQSMSPQKMKQEWPFQSITWRYQASWTPPWDSSIILAALALPIALAGAVDALGVGPARSKASSSRAAWFVEVFAPQRCFKALAAPQKGDSPVLHVTRVVLQLIVCWQHALLVMDWMGNEGKEGISAAYPVTHGLAQTSMRVNTTFACLSANLVFKSLDKAFAKAQPNGKPAADVKAPKKGLLFTVATIWAWCAKRWVVQALELGLWTFYFLRIAAFVPWRPFPEFASVWYNSRVAQCARMPKPGSGRLPMWLLSSMLIYGPTHTWLGDSDKDFTMCHNMAIFEVLFLTSCTIAVLAGVRHLLPRRLFGALTTVVVAVAVRHMIVPDPHNMQLKHDWRQDYIHQSLPRLLPPSVIMVSLCDWLGAGRGARPWRLIAVLLATTSVIDFLFLCQGHIGSNWRMQGYGKMVQKVVGMWSALTRLPLFESLAARQMLAVACELPHVLGLALLSRDHNPGEGDAAGGCAWWVVLLSRLSLGINLVNLFVIHYVAGRVHLYPLEFSLVHLGAYTALAWFAGAVLSFGSQCIARPYAACAVSLGRRLLAATGLPRLCGCA